MTNNIYANGGAYKVIAVLNYVIKYHERGDIVIKEYKGFLVDDDLNIYNERTGNKVTPFIGTDGYYQVSRRDESGKHKHIRVHSLFANMFIDNPNNYKYVNHKDSNKLNNSLDNLEWCTNAYNVYHGWHSGNRTHKNKTKVVARKDGWEKEYPSIRALSKDLHVDRHKVARILKGQLENHYEYVFDYVAECGTTIEKPPEE